MSDKLDLVIGLARKGTMSRREFMGRTTAMGVSAGIASALFAKVARADEPVRGGTLRVGLSGGSRPTRSIRRLPPRPRPTSPPRPGARSLSM